MKQTNNKKYKRVYPIWSIVLMVIIVLNTIGNITRNIEQGGTLIPSVIGISCMVGIIVMWIGRYDHNKAVDDNK